MTKSEIRRKISKAENELNAYNESLKKANLLYKSLDDSKKHLNIAILNMVKYFTFTTTTADGGDLAKVVEKIDSYLTKLTKEIIPAINSKINSLKNEIRRLKNDLQYAEE